MRLVFAVAACIAVCAAPTAAQTNSSHWGVSVNFAPKWETPEQAGYLFDTEPQDFSGSEFRVGLVRGRDLGGEWGISYIRKNIKDGSTLGEVEEQCFDPGACALFGELYFYNGVTVDGVILHKFMPFATIARRVQIGLTVGGGIGRWKGTAEGVEYNAEFSLVDNSTIVVTQTETRFPVDPEELFVVKPMPLGEVQLSVAAILAPGLKLRASGGVNFPGYQTFSIAASYLFGAR